MRDILKAIVCWIHGHQPPFYAPPYGTIFCRRCRQPIGHRPWHRRTI